MQGKRAHRTPYRKSGTFTENVEERSANTYQAPTIHVKTHAQTDRKRGKKSQNGKMKEMGWLRLLMRRARNKAKEGEEIKTVAPFTASLSPSRKKKSSETRERESHEKAKKKTTKRTNREG